MFFFPKYSQYPRYCQAVWNVSLINNNNKLELAKTGRKIFFNNKTRGSVISSRAHQHASSRTQFLPISHPAFIRGCFGVLVSQDCYKRVLQTRWLLKLKMYPLTVLKVKSPNQGVDTFSGGILPCLFLLHCRKSFMFLGSLLHHFSLCLSHHMAFILCVCVSAFPSSSFFNCDFFFYSK